MYWVIKEKLTAWVPVIAWVWEVGLLGSTPHFDTLGKSLDPLGSAVSFVNWE